MTTEGIGDLMIAAALEGANEVDVLARMCERLDAAGLRLMRASVASDLLDPTFDARGVLWTRVQGGFDEVFPRRIDGDVAESWRRSPFFALLESGEPMLRRRLDATYVRGEFPILDRFHDEGATDYVAMVARVGDAVILGKDHPLTMAPTPRVLVRHGLEAELSRPIYYELAELALAEGRNPPGLWSDGAFFPFGDPE